MAVHTPARKVVSDCPVPRESLPDGSIVIAIPRSRRRVVGSQFFDGIKFDEAPPYTRDDPVLGEHLEYCIARCCRRLETNVET